MPKKELAFGFGSDQAIRWLGDGFGWDSGCCMGVAGLWLEDMGLGEGFVLVGGIMGRMGVMGYLPLIILYCR